MVARKHYKFKRPLNHRAIKKANRVYRGKEGRTEASMAKTYDEIIEWSKLYLENGGLIDDGTTEGKRYDKSMVPDNLPQQCYVSNSAEYTKVSLENVSVYNFPKVEGHINPRLHFYNHNHKSPIEAMLPNAPSKTISSQSVEYLEFNSKKELPDKISLKIDNQEVVLTENVEDFLKVFPLDEAEELMVLTGVLDNSEINNISRSMDIDEEDIYDANSDVYIPNVKKQSEPNDVVFFALDGALPDLDVNKVYEIDDLSDEALMSLYAQFAVYFDVSENDSYGKRIFPKSIEHTSTWLDKIHKYGKSPLSGISVGIDILRHKTVRSLIVEDFNTSFFRKGNFRFEHRLGEWKIIFEGKNKFRMSLSHLAKKTSKVGNPVWKGIQYASDMKHSNAIGKVTKNVVTRGNIISLFVCGAINIAKWLTDEEYTLENLAVDLAMDSLKIVISSVLAGIVAGFLIGTAPVWFVVGGTLMFAVGVGVGLDMVDDWFGVSDYLSGKLKEINENETIDLNFAVN